MRVRAIAVSFRTALVTVFATAAVLCLGLLLGHYGLSSQVTQSENNDLKSQIRGLVDHVAEVEAVLIKVNAQRRALDQMTQTAITQVLSTTDMDAMRDGRLYLATVPTPGHSDPGAVETQDEARRVEALKQRASVLIDDLNATTKQVTLRQEILAHVPSRLPAQGWISSEYGLRVSPFHGSGEKMHNGVDIAADEGTPVYAPADGTVVFAGTFGGFGKYIRINHGFGIVTRYAHNAELLVKRGDKVRRGDQISVIGVTGRTTGPHLHYEVLVHDQPVNPARFFYESGKVPTPALASARPMGGEADLPMPGDGMTLTSSSAAFQGERLIFASALPIPFREATTSDIISLGLVLIVLAIVSALARGQPAQATGGKRRANRSYDWGVWSNPPWETNEEEEEF